MRVRLWRNPHLRTDIRGEGFCSAGDFEFRIGFGVLGTGLPLEGKYRPRPESITQPVVLLR